MHSLIAYLGVQGDFNALQFREMMRGELSRYAKRGLATLCIGGGMGVAMCLERG